MKCTTLRDAAPVNRGELQNGDLVFFRTQGRGTADHVGVYGVTGSLFSPHEAVRTFRSPRLAKTTGCVTTSAHAAS